MRLKPVIERGVCQQEAEVTERVLIPFPLRSRFPFDYIPRIIMYRAGKVIIF